MDPVEVAPSDTVSRVLGLSIGAAAGAGLFWVLDRAGIPQAWFLSIPGIGLAVGAGVFSYRRNLGWGVVAAALAVVWVAVFLWMIFPLPADVPSLAWAYAGTLPGLVHFPLAAAVGLAAGAGWQKRLPALGELDDDG